MVRGLQHDSTRGGELGATRVPADHEPRDFPRTHRDQPDPGPKEESAPKAHPLPVARGIGRLHEVLDGYQLRRPSCKAQADIIRLLLLTGCRTGEILKLRWREVGGDTLELEDSKTGPRQVLLSPEARAIIERQPRSGSPWVFPSPVNPARTRFDLSLWKKVRKLAGIEDVRRHDLRHTFASQAAMQGIPLPVVARLLGHAQVQMTLRYAHVSDRDVEAAAERIGGVMAGVMNKSPARPDAAP